MEDKPLWIIFPDLYIATVINSGLSVGCSFIQKSRQLVTLNFSFNSIEKLTKNCFSETVNLKVVAMKDNLMNHIQIGTFEPLHFLQFLDLSNNCFTNIATLRELGLKKLRLLSLNNFSLSSLKQNIFLDIEVKFFQTNDFFLCCLMSIKTHCTQKKPWVFGCEGLLPTHSLKITFYLISGTILLANFVSMILQKTSHDGNVIFQYIVAFISTAHIFCATSLFILWLADLVYESNFVFLQFSWRSGSVCFLHFGVCLLFSFLCPALLSFLSFARLQVVMNPCSTDFRRTGFVLKYLLWIVAGVCVVSVGLTVQTWIITKGYGLPFSLCSPFVDPTNSLKIIDILTWVVSLSKTAACVFIFINYVKLIWNFKASQQKIAKAKSETKSNISLIVQLVIITASNLLCWISTSAIYLAAQFLEKYPISMLIWTTVCVAPINSIANPVIFIMTTFRNIKRAQQKKVYSVILREISAHSKESQAVPGVPHDSMICG